jgi:hypothetical protein
MAKIDFYPRPLHTSGQQERTIMTTLKTLKEAESLAASHGILLSERERAHIQEAQSAELARLKATAPLAPLDLAARWNRAYPRLLQSIISIGETVLTFSQTVIVSLGVPIVLVLLLIVEHQRVVHGISLFEQDHSLASFAALALVLLNLVLEFQIHHIENAAGYHEEQGKRWSLWIWAQNAAYTLGIGESWTVQYVSPAARYKGLLRLVTFSILALALVGSMRAVIEGQSGAWYEAIGAIMTQSSLLLLMTWIGGLLFAAAAVLAAQGLSRYVAIRCVEILAAMHTQQTEAIDPYAASVDQAGALALTAIINAKLEAKAAKEAAKKPKVEAVVIEPRPFGQVLPTPEEPVFTPIHALENGHGGNGNGKH